MRLGLHRVAAILFIEILPAQRLVRAQTSSQEIVKFPYRIERFSVPDSPQSVLISQIGDFVVCARYANRSESDATFTLKRGNRILQTIRVKDLWNPNGWVAISPAENAFALTWSDGGAIGGFHTRVFVRTAKGDFAERPAIVQNVIRDFEARHYCKSRGDNFAAVGWVNPNHLVIEASVYPTSDCGPDLGHTERYVVVLSNGAIQKRVHIQNRTRLARRFTLNLDDPPKPHRPLRNPRHPRLLSK